MAGLRLGDIPRIQGTSSRTRYLETSVGCTAVDALMGGGLPLSSVYLIDEDRSRAYANVLSKYFIAEGVCCEHSLFIASTSRNPHELLENLPDKVAVPEDPTLEDDVDVSSQNSKMKIAWRYSTVKKMDSSMDAGTRQGAAHFDLMNKMDLSRVEACDITIFPENDSSRSRLPCYDDLYRRLRQKLSENDFVTSSSPKSAKRVLRIVIEGIGAPLWEDPENDLKFVAHLRTALCSSYAVAMLIVNTSGMEVERKKRLYEYGDLVVQLKEVEDASTVQKLDDRFDGYFRLLKLPTIASIATHCLASSDLVFQLQKRKFDIRILHLPPALDDDNKQGPGLSCQKMLDGF